MNKLFFKKTFIYFGIILFIFLADRISKLYILSVLEDLGFVDIDINSYINLILVWNTGIGFGLLSFDQSAMYNLMTILIIFINLFIVYLIIKSKDNTAYFFLIGSDNLINLHKWKNWKQLLKICQITIFPRKGYITKSLNSKAFKTMGKSSFLLLKSKMINISSSKIRKNYLKYKYL